VLVDRTGKSRRRGDNPPDFPDSSLVSARQTQAVDRG
jgi:hypothetical protein